VTEDVRLTANYVLSEFEKASHRALTPAEKERAGRFARELLQPARRAMGWPIFITSFVRTRDVGSGAHADGGAVDVQPCKSCGGQAISKAEFEARLESLFVFLATYMPHAFGSCIHERTHVHLTLPGVQGRTGVVMREPIEGEYELASFTPLAVFPVGALVGGGLLLWWLHKG
jgi:hypothetical protein